MTVQDFRIGFKVVATLEIEDKGQDFTELDILENGVILGSSPMFSNGRLCLVGIGTEDGMDYFSRDEVLLTKKKLNLKGLSLYMKNTGAKDPLPWEAQVLRYKIIKTKKVVKPNRFIK